MLLTQNSRDLLPHEAFPFSFSLWMQVEGSFIRPFLVQICLAKNMVVTITPMTIRNLPSHEFITL
jgi:hypothetical protein